MSQFNINFQIADVQSQVRSLIENCDSQDLNVFSEKFDISVEKLIDGVNLYLKSSLTQASQDSSVRKDLRDTVDDIDDLSVNVMELIGMWIT
jgi:hypothetical protein